MKSKDNKKEVVIPEELTGSYPKTPIYRSFNEDEFVKWFSNIVLIYHPKNNEIYDYVFKKP